MNSDFIKDIFPENYNEFETCVIKEFKDFKLLSLHLKGKNIIIYFVIEIENGYFIFSKDNEAMKKINQLNNLKLNELNLNEVDK